MLCPLFYVDFIIVGVGNNLKLSNYMNTIEDGKSHSKKHPLESLHKIALNSFEKLPRLFSFNQMGHGQIVSQSEKF